MVFEQRSPVTGVEHTWDTYSSMKDSRIKIPGIVSIQFPCNSSLRNHRGMPVTIPPILREGVSGELNTIWNRPPE